MKAKSRILFVLFLSILFVQCKKSNEVIKTKNNTPQIGAFFSDVAVIEAGPENESNPYDFVGKLHNEGLTYLVVHAQNYYINNELNRDSFKYYSDQYYTSIAAKYIDSMYSQNNSEDSINVFLNRFNTGIFYSLLSDVSTNLTVSQRFYFDQISSEIDSFSNFLAFKSSIIQIENAIMASSLPENDKMVLLMGTAVSRYSAHYWSTVSIESIRDYFNDNNFPPTSAIGNILKWDFQGAVMGGVAGLYAGLSSGAYVFGPGGVVVTAVGGATIGAIRGSFVDLLWELFWAGMNWFQN
jgi:hypothetical protein